MLGPSGLYLVIATAACLVAGAAPTQAQERTLTMAVSREPSSMDPHFHQTIPNNATHRQVYDSLLDYDARAVVRPRLAEGWRVLDDRTWEFRLREGVRFHDGTPFEAEDIAFSYSRAAAIKGSPASFAPNVSSIAVVEVVDPRTLRIRTREPDPFLDRSLANVVVLSRHVHAAATAEDFATGRLVVGTGPYRHVSYARGERHEIAANPDFWGGKPPWDRVTTRYVPDSGARVAALERGDADLIDTVPPQEVRRLSADPRYAVFSTDGITSVFLNPHGTLERVPHVWDRQGRPLEKNPLADRRVRWRRCAP